MAKKKISYPKRKTSRTSSTYSKGKKSTGTKTVIIKI